MLGERNHANQSTGGSTSSKNSMSGKKRKMDDGKLKKQSIPFYVSKANFFSLLNIGDMIEQSGTMRNCWEGENESYIQNVKREISTMK